jgi:hypothetical protein
MNIRDRSICAFIYIIHASLTTLIRCIENKLEHNIRKEERSKYTYILKHAKMTFGKVDVWSNLIEDDLLLIFKKDDRK